MNTTTARPIRRQRTLADLKPLRFPTELRAAPARHLPEPEFTANHDFLVPNPRPDLTGDFTYPAHVE